MTLTPLARITPATVDVLRVLQGDSPVWGMLVIKQIGRPAGSVYPILERLEGAGWVSSSWEAATDRHGPRRRLYELTSEGAVAARSAIAQFETRARAARTPAAPAPAARQAFGAGRIAGAGLGLGAGDAAGVTA
ncbi:PadR family transcriptional regulator [Herbiconiux liukaitaii]|uniref:PadR family transcriptional regulator n=1 Tax=Herbiconiux liukaitaii TaxID=3342799 RepID=UPI0035BAB4F3